MRVKPSKSFIDIRVRLKVQNDSHEAWLYKFLNDENATPYVRQKLILDCLITHLSPLVYEYQGSSPDLIRQSLVDANQAWQSHFRYLQQRLGIHLNSSLNQDSVPVAVPIETSSVVTSLSDEEDSGVTITEEEVYPDVF